MQKRKIPLSCVYLLHDISCYNAHVCMLHVPVLHLTFIVCASKGIHIVLYCLTVHVHITSSVAHEINHFAVVCTVSTSNAVGHIL